MINLSKGQRIDLTKSYPSLNKYKIGLKWEIKEYNTGFDFDLDVSVFVLNSNNKLISDSHFVFYNNQKSPEGFVEHISGDDLKGGKGEDVLIDFSKKPSEVNSVLIVVTIHDAKNRRQSFGQVKNATLKIINPLDESVLMNFDLSEDFSTETAVTAGKIYKKDNEFRFEAVSSGFIGGLEEYLKIHN